MEKQEKSGLEIIESAEVLQKEINKAEGFLKTNQKLLTLVGGIVLAAIVGFFGYKYWNNTQNDAAQEALVDATFAFEADSLKQALEGAGGGDGLLSVADEYGSTKAGNLAKMYAGIALLKQGKFDDAIKYLSDFKSSDYILQGKAYALVGDAYMEKKNAAEAASFYKKAADYNANKYLTPAYLMKLAIAYETAGNNAEAIDAYSEIIEKYPLALEVVNAKKYKGKLEAAK